MITEFIVLFVTTLFLWLVCDNYFSTKKYPPGPMRLPLLGNALQLFWSRSAKRPPFVRFQELSEKYGPLCYIRVGLREVVLIDDFEIAKHILNHEVWVDRPFNARVAERSFGKPLGIIFVSGDGWKEMRRFSMRTLRDFGYGKQTSMQAVLDDEVKALVAKVERVSQEAEKNGEDPILEIKHLFTMPVLNILWSMVSNIRTKEDDVKLRKLIVLVDNLAKANPIVGNISAVFPFIRHIFPNWTGHNFAKKCHKELQQYFRDVLEKRRKEGCYAEDKRDFIDMFVQEIDKHSKLKSNPNFYTDEQFITTITDLFEAGSETSSNTMEFAIYFIMKNMEVQKRVQEEIDRVVGRNRFPTTADRAAMPYTEATLLEVQRMANVLPLTIRCPTADFKFNGFDITKGTSAVVNIYSIHMNTSFWGDPFTFRPERFLDENMKIRPDIASRVIPFGAGKRVCLGEQMARTTIFTYFTSLLQNYSFEEIHTDTKHEEKFFKGYIEVGFTLSPKTYATRLIKRN